MGIGGAIVAINLMNSSSRGGGYVDPRPRCKCCGQLLPKQRGFREWLNNSPAGIALIATAATIFFFYATFTFIGWTTPDYGQPQGTLIHYIHGQWEWIVQTAKQLW